MSARIAAGPPASVSEPSEPEGDEAPAARPPRRFSRSPLGRRLRDLGRSPLVVRIAGRLIFSALGAVRLTQRLAPGSSPYAETLAAAHPAIVALWHGQHLLAPFFRPKSLPYVALLSRNADAAINASVVEHFGIRTVRGSGGRVRKAGSKKGGARALIQLLRMLRDGFGVCMIADVPKGTPREAGLGIVTLARLSGRPIIPAAAVTSRRRVLERTWDRTTVPLPFGRIAVVMGEPILVPADADEALMDEKRRQVTAAIEAANRRAAAIADRTAPLRPETA